MAEWRYIVAKPVRVGVRDQLQPVFGDDLIAKRDHFRKLPAGIDMHQRKRQLARMKRLERQMQQYRRVLADRVQHDRTLEFGSHFPEDVDRLVFQRFQVRVERRLAAPVFNHVHEIVLAKDYEAEVVTLGWP